ncbi:MAG: hypothetical protein N0C82_16620 [Candidatus Thiodiazotropha endolucinida]|nr:hypothetical protein [Candidatus Thiodiazotropha taylori]MCW4269210.1 hypothetical protein [Candidatus Thiodiazotropha endolucinida]MCG8032818.1 hypothetical protein [Candidatus Thiodiazotropha taylori]MCG8121241.1 hypothetical protein [Candidatus Thiodiazotropha taylori]MCW4296934.1 hypothetical protein [Candidatus Thiodiazotropha endolucinida]
MGIFTDARQAQADRYNEARQRTVERFLSNTYSGGRAAQDLLTRYSTETAEHYQLRQERYADVIGRLRAETRSFRDHYAARHKENGDPFYGVTAKLLAREVDYLEICLRIVQENLLRVEDAALFANRLGWITRNVRKGWLAEAIRKAKLPDEVKAIIKKM